MHAHAPTCRYSLCSFSPSYRESPSSFCAVRWRLKYEPPSISLYRRRAMRAPRSYCVTGARARGGLQGLYRAANLFFCACDVFTFVILTGPVWFDVARARTCLGPDVVIILWSLVLRIVFVYLFFVSYIILWKKWLWCSANMFDSNILLNFYNEIAHRSALQLARWGIVVCLLFISVALLRVNRYLRGPATPAGWLTQPCV